MFAVLWTVCVTCETGPLVGAGAGAEGELGEDGALVVGVGAGRLGVGLGAGRLGAGAGRLVVGVGAGRLGAGALGVGAGTVGVGVGAGNVGVGAGKDGVETVGVVSVGAGGRSSAAAGAVRPAAKPMAAIAPSETCRQFIPTL